MAELLCVLATWRLSSWAVNERGPYDIFAKWRHWVGVRYDEHSNCTGSGLAPLFCCLWCASSWMCIPFAIYLTLKRGESWSELCLYWLAFSTGAIIIQSLIEGLSHGAR